MTKKDGATDRVQAISDVCHALRHADLLQYGPSAGWEAKVGEARARSGVSRLCPFNRLAASNKDGHAATERPGPILDALESCRLGCRCSPAVVRRSE
jgi:hypothetical protein